MNEPQPFAPAAAATKNGLGIASLVLGILSLMCFGILTGIPAIITGHMARGRAKRLPEVYGGQGMALAGLILGYVVSPLVTFFQVAILSALLLPMFAAARRNAQSMPPPMPTPQAQSGSCMNNLKQVALAARLWANDHDDRLPANFLTMSNELVSPKILVCPGDQMKTIAADWAQFNMEANVSYEFLKPGTKNVDVMTQTVFRCPVHGHAALGDGSVQSGKLPARQ